MNILKLIKVDDLGTRESIKHKGKFYRRIEVISEDNKIFRFNTSEQINNDLLSHLAKLELPYDSLEEGISFGNNKLEYQEVILPIDLRETMFRTTLFKK